jgi:uncharacterized membrane protein YphA (DoxX/SURF4 family)
VQATCIPAAMLTRGFSTFLALLRIAAGVSLLLAGTQKMSWFGSTAHLDPILASWAQHPAAGPAPRSGSTGWSRGQAGAPLPRPAFSEPR